MSKPTTCTKADLEVDRPVSPEQQPPPTRFAGGISSSPGPTLENGPARSSDRESVTLTESLPALTVLFTNYGFIIYTQVRMTKLQVASGALSTIYS